jgi:hypothetical protein
MFTSRPVAMMTSALPVLKAFMANSRSSCDLPPCELTAFTPLSSRYSSTGRESARERPSEQASEREGERVCVCARAVGMGDGKEGTWVSVR